MKNRKVTAFAIALSCVLVGCATPTTDRTIAAIGDERVRADAAMSSPVVLKPRSRVSDRSGVMLPVTVVKAPVAGDWLRRVTINVDFVKPTPLSAVVASLAAQGINIAAAFPLDSYTFSGRLTNADGETALRAVMASAGLDFTSDDARKLVTITTMRSRTFLLNTGNRRGTFGTDGASASASSATNQQGGSGASSSTKNAGQGAPGGGVAAESSNSTNANSSSQSGGALGGNGLSGAQSTGITVGDDIWSALDAELSRRLQVMVPAPRATTMPIAPAPIVPALSMQPAQAIGMPSTNSGSGEMFVKRTVGHYSLNPETGAIVVQAPSWILEDLSLYLKGVQDMYNSLITFRGQLMLVTTAAEDNEGFDITAFADFASKYGLIISNNALGGITVSTPSNGSGLPSVSAPNATGPLVGLRVTGAKSALQVFTNFLSNHGRVSIMQRPVINTTSGSPGVFSQKKKDYFNTVSQQAAAGGTGSAAVGTSNTLVEYQTGVELKVNPRLDVSTGLVRSPLDFWQLVEVGKRSNPQTITVGNNALTVDTATPVLQEARAKGEVLLREGDLVIVGGQTETIMDTDASGLSGRDGPLVGLLGKRSTTKRTATTYFALEVEVHKRK